MKTIDVEVWTNGSYPGKVLLTKCDGGLCPVKIDWTQARALLSSQEYDAVWYGRDIVTSLPIKVWHALVSM